VGPRQVRPAATPPVVRLVGPPPCLPALLSALLSVARRSTSRRRAPLASSSPLAVPLDFAGAPAGGSGVPRRRIAARRGPGGAGVGRVLAVLVSLPCVRGRRRSVDVRLAPPIPCRRPVARRPLSLVAPPPRPRACALTSLLLTQGVSLASFSAAGRLPLSGSWLPSCFLFLLAVFLLPPVRAPCWGITSRVFDVRHPPPSSEPPRLPPWLAPLRASASRALAASPRLARPRSVPALPLPPGPRLPLACPSLSRARACPCDPSNGCRAGPRFRGSVMTVARMPAGSPPPSPQLEPWTAFCALSAAAGWRGNGFHALACLACGVSAFICSQQARWLALLLPRRPGPACAGALAFRSVPSPRSAPLRRSAGAVAPPSTSTWHAALPRRSAAFLLRPLAATWLRTHLLLFLPSRPFSRPSFLCLHRLLRLPPVRLFAAVVACPLSWRGAPALLRVSLPCMPSVSLGWWPLYALSASPAPAACAPARSLLCSRLGLAGRRPRARSVRGPPFACRCACPASRAGSSGLAAQCAFGCARPAVVPPPPLRPPSSSTPPSQRPPLASAVLFPGPPSFRPLVGGASPRRAARLMLRVRRPCPPPRLSLLRSASLVLPALPRRPPRRSLGPPNLRCPRVSPPARLVRFCPLDFNCFLRRGVA